MTDPTDAVRPTTATGCHEFSGLSRRGLLRGALVAGAGMTSVATLGSAFVQTSYAATRSAPAVLVVLSMRGAVDGMSLVVPHGDPVYYTARPRIAVPASTLLAKDGFFGLHPNLAPLMPLWNAGRMATVHATGLPAPNRSHFSAIEEVEDADPGSSARVGWLNRLIGRDAYEHPLRAVQLGESVPPAALAGPRPSVAVESIADMRLAGADQWDRQGRRPASMRTMWADARGPLGVGARSAMGAIDDFGPVRATSGNPANGASYPGGDLGKALAATARTIRGDVGAEVITIDHGSWDHHVNLGPLDWGSMQQMTTELARGIAAFFTDLGPLAGKVTLVTISEFGRRTKENANYGLDHGFGTAMMLFGAGVKGGYHGSWPGLTGGANDDLLVTTDFRSVLSEVVTKRLGASSAQVFPGFQPEAVGAMA
ncbi:DUF1501 domain-containing protein [Nocardioides caeni]|uniref:DUF1501 domain-containing protein n=1 Tax=Nocardioides caeni TaxID=574700 RepID=A0A4S8NSV9_9ACTN|nr:DUF1501 domain-containing protein [Nocardioides caeni]THV18349.1 DUF1501 domain-containing protein [Nocardioides caeni]